MIESYVINSQINYPDTPTYTESLSVEHAGELYKALDDEFHIIMIRYKWEIFSSNSAADHNLLPVTCYFKCKSKSNWNTSKFKARYCVIGYVYNRLSPEPLNLYSPVFQWSIVRLILML